MCVPFTNCTGPLAATSHCDGGGFYGNSTTLQYPICNNQGVGHGQSFAKKFDVASCARRFWSGYWAALKGVNVWPECVSGNGKGGLDLGEECGRRCADSQAQIFLFAAEENGMWSERASVSLDVRLSVTHQ